MMLSIVSSSSFVKGLNFATHARFSACYAFSGYEAGKGDTHTRNEGGLAPVPAVIEMFGKWASQIVTGTATGQVA